MAATHALGACAEKRVGSSPTIPTKAPLAHAWLEQRSHKPLVPCSTHGGGTKNIFYCG